MGGGEFSVRNKKRERDGEMDRGRESVTVRECMCEYMVKLFAWYENNQQPSTTTIKN